MKPHEETWTAKLEENAGYDCTTDAYVVRNEHDHRVFDFGSGYEHNDKARSALAAQAPAMARLLLSLEWAGGHSEPYDSTTACCPSCDADAPQTIHFPAKRIDAYTRTEARDEVIGGVHAPTCALVATLRAAGVIE